MYFNASSCLTLHFEESVLRHFFAVALHLLLHPLLVVLVRGADHHGLTLEACEQAHLPLLARGRQVSLEEEEEEKGLVILGCAVQLRRSLTIH